MGTWRLLVVILLGSVLCLADKDKDHEHDHDDGKHHKKGGTCPEGQPLKAYDPKNPGVFDSLSAEEINSVRDYLVGLRSFGIRPNDRASSNSTYIFLIERQLPKKKDILDHLDNSKSAPVRSARAVLVRGDMRNPTVEEYNVSPVPNPHTHTLINRPKWRHPIPYNSRSMFEHLEWDGINAVVKRAAAQLELLFKESTSGYSYGSKCGDKCLIIMPNGPASPRDTGKMWLWFCRDLEGYYLHPVPIQFLVNFKSPYAQNWYVEKVWYSDKVYGSVDELKRAYNGNRLSKVVIPTPAAEDLFSSIKQKGTPVPEKPQRGPLSFMPDGRRFTLHGHHLMWQGWAMHLNMHTSRGPQLFNVKFNAERIIYELSFQETMVYYSGRNPASMHQVYFDGGFVLGTMASPLVENVDCPSGAAYIDYTHFKNGETRHYPRSTCVFELNTGLPLRRHYENDQMGGYRFAGGMPDNVLVVRSVLSVYNYDYIVDYIFRQSGAIETRVALCGYVLTHNWAGFASEKYGFQIADGILGNMHAHFAHFKVDLDVKGTSNRFMTLNIDTENITDPNHPGNRIVQNKLTRRLKATEKDAAYKFDFNSPKYLLFYNEMETNKYNSHRAYRLLPVSMAKSTIPERYNWENAASWTRYQVAVTKHRDTEEASSVLYNYFEPFRPVVDFQSFIDDNESIMDEDIVTWVTLGTHHIPHTEDIPVTSTTGVTLSFQLVPYNYFDQDASIASRDNVYIKPGKNGETMIDRNGNKDNVDCQPAEPMFGKSTSGSGVMRPAQIVIGVMFLVLALW